MGERVSKCVYLAAISIPSTGDTKIMKQYVYYSHRYMNIDTSNQYAGVFKARGLFEFEYWWLTLRRPQSGWQLSSLGISTLRQNEIQLQQWIHAQLILVMRLFLKVHGKQCPMFGTLRVEQHLKTQLEIVIGEICSECHVGSASTVFVI